MRDSVGGQNPPRFDYRGGQTWVTYTFAAHTPPTSTF